MAGCGDVRVGSRVSIRDEDGDATFRLVEPGDADLGAERVSVASPLGRALLRRRQGDEVRFRPPGGVLTATILEVGG